MSTKVFFFIGIIALVLGVAYFSQAQLLGGNVLIPSQGGTGLSSSTAGQVGNCIKVLDDSPFRYELGTCGSGGGGGTGSNFTYTVNSTGNIYVTPSTTPAGLLVGPSASSTLSRLFSNFSTSTNATSTTLMVTDILTAASSSFGTAWIGDVIATSTLRWWGGQGCLYTDNDYFVTATGANCVSESRQIIAGSGLTGGGTLTGDVTLDAASGGSLTVSANSIDLNMANANTWTALQTFNGGLVATNATTTTFNSAIITGATSTIGTVHMGEFHATGTTATSTIANYLQIGGGQRSGMLSLTPNRAMPTSESVGGAFNINMGTQTGSAAVFYTNAGAGAGAGVQVVCDSASHDNTCFRVRSDGTAESTVNIAGAPLGKGILKVGASGAGDADGAVLSLDASTNSYLGQLIFGICGTSVNCVQIRDSGGTPRLLMDNGGNLVQNSASSTIVNLTMVNSTTTRATTTFLAVTNHASTSRLQVSNGFFQDGFSSGCTGNDAETVLYDATTGKFTCGTDSAGGGGSGGSNWTYLAANSLGHLAIQPSTTIGVLINASSSVDRLFTRYGTTTESTTTYSATTYSSTTFATSSYLGVGSGSNFFRVSSNGRVNLPANHVIDWDNGDITLTHASNQLTLGGATTFYTGHIVPSSNDAFNLGNGGEGWNTIYVGTGKIDFDNGSAVIDYASGRLNINTFGFGNVGIGTSSPWANFSVEQTTLSGPAFVVSDQGTSTPHFYVEGNGRVGVGTSNPGALFTVNGLASTTSLTVSGLGNTGTECLQISNQGVVDNSGSACGGGSGLSAPLYIQNARVGLGTSTPGKLFSIAATSTTGTDQSVYYGVNSFIYASSSTSTIPNLTPYAWSLATSSTVTPIITVDTSAGNYLQIGNPTFANFASTSRLGIASNTPLGTLSVGNTNSSPLHAFIIGSSTATAVDVYNSGRVFMPLLTQSGAAQTYYMCGTATFELIWDTTTCVVSAERFKKDIRPLDIGLKELREATPIWYHLRNPVDDPNAQAEQLGFLAEDLEKIDKRLVTYDKDGQLKGVRYEQITAWLAKSIQELDEEKTGSTNYWPFLGLIGLVGLIPLFRRRS